MSIKDQLPTDEIMRSMAKIAMEQATSYFSVQARGFARNLPPSISGRDALEAFARAIESTNLKVWPKSGAPM